MTAPLEGVYVLEHTHVAGGALATRVLADLGAAVIKVVPAPASDSAQAAVDDVFNAGKRLVAVDMEQPQGVALFKRLASLANVVVEDDARPCLSAYGSDFAALQRERPDLIYVRLSDYAVPVSEENERRAGNAAPLKSDRGGFPFGPQPFLHILMGLTAAGAILTALHYRRRTGKGQQVEVSCHQAALPIAAYALMAAQMMGRSLELGGDWSPWAVPQGYYPCRDEGTWLAISVQNDAQWQALCRVSGHSEWEDDERFLDVIARSRNQDALDRVIASWTRTQDPYQAFHALQRAGVPAAPVLKPREIRADPHLSARCFAEQQGSQGHHGYAASPTLTAKSRRCEARPVRSAPGPGAHAWEVLQTLLGLSEDELRRLEEEGIIGLRSASR